MSFVQPDYWFYLILVLSIFVILRDELRVRVAYLAIISMAYYALCSGYYVLLLLFTIVFTYFITLKIEKIENEKQRKLVLVLGVFFIVLVLGYYNWLFLIINSLRYALGINLNAKDYIFDFVNTRVGTSGVAKHLVPMGLSFFSLHQISYVVDVYRKKIPANKSFFEFALYVSFFPQIISGPIIRAQDFMPQVQGIKFRKDLVWPALLLILYGLFKKICFADIFSLNLVHPVYDQPSEYGTAVMWVAALGNLMMVYCDLSGYTDIAIGTAMFFNIRLPENFRETFKSTSVNEFWRRWHISIYAWMRDYVYIPLGGNKVGPARRYLNLFITFMLVAIWHGTSLHMLFWGFANYVLMLLAQVQDKIRVFEGRYSKLKNVLGILFTAVTFFTAGIWFSANFKNGITIFNKMYLLKTEGINLAQILNFQGSLILIAIGAIVHFISAEQRQSIKNKFLNSSNLSKVLMLIISILILSQVASKGGAKFIYGQH